MISLVDFCLDAQAVARSLVKLPSLPAIVMDLLRSLEDENASDENLAKKISADQALVARLLRVANSSFYGLQRKVSSVPDAIFVIGMASVRNIALSATVFDPLSRQLDARGFDFPYYWRHSLATALCAEILAPKFRCARDSAFAAGLMHDIGQLVLAICFPRHQKAVARYQHQHDCYRHEAERAVLGVDHAALGRTVMQHWNFPAALCEAVAAHHEPDSIAGDGMSCVLHLADVIVHGLDLDRSESERVPRVNALCWRAAGLSPADGQVVFSRVESGLDALSGAFAIV